MILETKRLYLRTFFLADAARMSEYRNKPEVARFQSWKHYTLKDAIKRIQHCQKVIEYNRPKTDYHLAIIQKKDDILIGDLFVEIINKSVFTLGYTLDSLYWSQGYALEIVQAFLDYMKETYHFKKVICYVYNENIRSIQLLHKLGFEKFDESYFYGDSGYMKKLR